jgi:thioesterase domain-containing protein
MTYPTSLSAYSTFCLNEQSSITERAEILIDNLKAMNLSGRTVIVGHSMGGLVLKQMLIISYRKKERG